MDGKGCSQEHISLIIIVFLPCDTVGDHLSWEVGRPWRTSVADWIHCRRGWNFRVIDLTIWKSCLEFLFEFVAFSSTLMPFSCCCLSTVSFLCTSAFSSWYRFLSLLFASLFPWLLWKSHQISISFATWRIKLFLWLFPVGLSWYLSRDVLGYLILCSLQCHKPVDISAANRTACFS